MEFEIENYSDEFDLEKYRELVEGLLEYALKQLDVEDRPVKVAFIKDLENSRNPLGKTAYYVPSDEAVAVYETGRHIKDMLRSLAHELVHHKQKVNDEFPDDSNATPGYALVDEELRELEREAYEKGNMIFRTFEDKLKSEKEVDDKLESLSDRLEDKFGFEFKPG